MTSRFGLVFKDSGERAQFQAARPHFTRLAKQFFEPTNKRIEAVEPAPGDRYATATTQVDAHPF